jgi:hypothetical protein
MKYLLIGKNEYIGKKFSLLLKPKIRKYAGIADEKLSTEQIMNLTRE